MPLTYHPVRLFRLSCGCLREYPMMPAGTGHAVLCVTCRCSAVTLHAYPERACGATCWATRAAGFSGRRVLLSCTLGPGRCTGLTHIDTLACLGFTVQATRLARSREGKTGRA
jgi:hypothetical protein